MAECQDGCSESSYIIFSRVNFESKVIKFINGQSASPELLDELLQGYENPEDLLGQGGILKQLRTALVERCLNAELKRSWRNNRLNPTTQLQPRVTALGHSKKTIKGEFGEAEISIPRDRDGEFEPVIVKKGQTRFDGFDDKILSLWARGMTIRDIQAQLQDLHGVEISAGLISNLTDAVETERKLWQNRSLDAVYSIVYFDAIVVKVRQEGRVINKAIQKSARQFTPLTLMPLAERFWNAAGDSSINP